MQICMYASQPTHSPAFHSMTHAPRVTDTCFCTYTHTPILLLHFLLPKAPLLVPCARSVALQTKLEPVRLRRQGSGLTICPPQSERNKRDNVRHWGCVPHLSLFFLPIFSSLFRTFLCPLAPHQPSPFAGAAHTHLLFLLFSFAPLHSHPLFSQKPISHTPLPPPLFFHFPIHQPAPPSHSSFFISPGQSATLPIFSPKRFGQATSFLPF